MAEANNKMASKHPQVILINDNNEDILGAAAIIAEQVSEFRAIPNANNIGKVVEKFQPPVILFALNTVMESIELYSKLVEEKLVSHNHDAILLCKNKESNIAFRACIKGLFDNYFVYQPLYEKFRLKIIVHNALIKHTVKKYEGITDEQFDIIDEELAELIDKGVECKSALSGSIQDCKNKLGQVVSESSEELTNEDPQKVLENIAKNHLAPMLESLEKELQISLDDMVATMVEKKTLATETRVHNQYQANERNKQLQKTVAKKKKRDEQQKLTEGSKEEAKIEANNEESSAIHLSDGNEPAAIDKPQPEQEEFAGEASEPNLITKQKSILVVEDNDLYREMLVKVLGDANYIVSQADDGLAALKLIKTKRYDCIIMDLFMPKLDGLNTTKHINKTGGDNPVPVIALTGNKRKDLFKKWASMGIKGYIIKPSSKAEILEQVEKCVTPDAT
ncbi:response regulator [Psychrosphaera sp. B3R10]|uniref:response regulator n=1 Tax=unclassified Psychrosphaera TaxID=2641570 RepID=UPI001C089B13|nr:response regulator [Psychrosphaera sp. I2R16]MBU2989789.1 response regulator [Psychrosphaera sp. B3R10]